MRKLVDKITLEFSMSGYNILAQNYQTIREASQKYVEDRYNEDYNYGAEYYYDYKVVNMQSCMDTFAVRAMICLLIYKDEEMAEVVKECTERLETGL